MSDLLMGSLNSSLSSSLSNSLATQAQAASGAAKTPAEKGSAREKAELQAAERNWAAMSASGKNSPIGETSEEGISGDSKGGPGSDAMDPSQIQAAMVQLSQASITARNAESTPKAGVEAGAAGATRAAGEGLSPSEGKPLVSEKRIAETDPALTGEGISGDFAKLLKQGQEGAGQGAGITKAPVQGNAAKQVRGGEEPPKSAVLNPKTLQSASSMKAASVMAGLQPWNKDWVFSGREGANPELKTMFQDSSKPTGEAAIETGLRDMIREALSGKSEGQPVAATTSRGASASAMLAELTGAKDWRSEPTSVSGEVLRTSDAQAMQASDGVDSSALQAQYAAGDFQPQAMGLGNALSLSSGAGAYGGAVAGLSGSDFVAAMASSRGNSREGAEAGVTGQAADTRGLRVIEGGKGESPVLGISQLKGKASSRALGGVSAGDEFLNTTPMPGVNGNPAASVKPLPLQLTGHVTQGAMTRERLSSEALSSLGSGIRNLGAQGGGEIRIRLKPENLGELHLRVVTRGNEVGLRIQASDDNSKKIIEESMGYLRESLSANQLSLARVEVTVAQAASSAFGSDNSSSQQQSSQQSFSGFDPQSQASLSNGQQQGSGFPGRDGRWDSGESEQRSGASASGRRSASIVPAQVAGSVGGASRWTTGGASGSSRLNVFA